MKSNASVSIVIPFYNEEEYIPYSVQIIDRTLKGNLNYEVILVDDGSTDRSAQIAAEQARLYENIRVITLPKNEGLGSALRAGFECASKDYILYTDMDLPFDFSYEFWRILSTANGHDLCFGQRLNKNESVKRRIYSKIFNLIINIFYNSQNADINFAMKFIKREKLKQIKLYSRGSFIDCELYLKFLFSGFNLKEIDLYYQERIYGSSHLGNYRNIFKIAIEFISIFPELYKMSKKKNKNINFQKSIF